MHRGDGLVVKQEPEPEAAPVSFTSQVVPGGFVGGVHVRTTVASGWSVSPVPPAVLHPVVWLPLAWEPGLAVPVVWLVHGVGVPPAVLQFLPVPPLSNECAPVVPTVRCGDFWSSPLEGEVRGRHRPDTPPDPPRSFRELVPACMLGSEPGLEGPCVRPQLPSALPAPPPEGLHFLDVPDVVSHPPPPSWAPLLCSDPVEDPPAVPPLGAPPLEGSSPTSCGHAS